MPNQRKIKVLQVNKMYYPEIGGVEKVVQQISEGLQDEIDVSVLACQRKGKKHQEIVNGVAVSKTSSVGVFFSMPVSLSFPFIFRKKVQQSEIVHIHLPNPLADFSLFLSNFKGKVIVSWHSDIIKQKKIMFFLKPLLHRTLKRADKIIVATQGHIEGSSFLKPYRDKCEIIPFGIERERIPQKIYFNKEKKTKNILFVGRLVYYKGIQYLIEAFKNIENAILRIVGDGQDRDLLENMIKDLGISHKIEFLGSLDDDKLKEEYKKCDLFVLPSIEKTEAFGLVQIEAMSYGKPVINTNLDSGVPYVSLNGVTGITVEPRNSDELARAIQNLVDDDDLRYEYAKNAYDIVSNNYILEENNNSILKLYEQILKENKDE